MKKLMIIALVLTLGLTVNAQRVRRNDIIELSAEWVDYIRTIKVIKINTKRNIVVVQKCRNKKYKLPLSGNKTVKVGDTFLVDEDRWINHDIQWKYLGTISKEKYLDIIKIMD